MSAFPAPPAENEATLAPQVSPDTLRLLAQRRSAKPFMLAPPGPSPAQLDALLKLATRVPDHGKLAPWRFIVFEGAGAARAGAVLAQLLEARGEATAETLQAVRETFTRAPLAIAIVSTAQPHVKIPEWEQVLSAGALAQNFIIAAHAMGFGAVWLTGWFCYDAEARAGLGLAAHERIAGVVHLGTQTQTQPERARPDAAALVTRF